MNVSIRAMAIRVACRWFEREEPRVAYRERKDRTKGPALDMGTFLREQGAKVTVQSPITGNKVKLNTLTSGPHRGDPKSQELLRKLFNEWKAAKKKDREQAKSKPDPSDAEQPSQAAPDAEESSSSMDEEAPKTEDEEAPKTEDEEAPKTEDEEAPKTEDEEAPNPKDEEAPNPKDEGPKEQPPQQGQEARPPAPAPASPPPEDARELVGDPPEDADPTPPQKVEQGEDPELDALLDAVDFVGKALKIPNLQPPERSRLEKLDDWLKDFIGEEDRDTRSRVKLRLPRSEDLPERAQAVARKHRLTDEHLGQFREFAELEKERAESSGADKATRQVQRKYDLDDRDVANIGKFFNQWKRKGLKPKEIRQKYLSTLKDEDQKKDLAQLTDEEFEQLGAPLLQPASVAEMKQRFITKNPDLKGRTPCRV